MRKHLFAVYAFARRGDDLADEPWTQDPAERLAALDAMDRSLSDATLAPDDPVFVALHATIRSTGLPHAPFQRLLTAFRSDVEFRTPATWDDVLAYCSNSADPVGEIILRLDHGHGEPSRDAIEASNAICTALQITNFLQDLGTDLPRGRSYLPIPDEDVIRRTAELFDFGTAVLGHVRSWRLRLELRAIIAGGRTMLHLCSIRTDRLQRPVLSAGAWVHLLRAFVRG